MKHKLEKIDPVFLEELNEIANHNCLVSGFRPSARRLTMAIRRESEYWPRLKRKIILTKLEDDRWKNVKE